ncbi:MAG TPA: Crp/Fnr family transcriptional regulator [Blastocatellia bacterium]|nr:Crp/Fnr family transcriptional regulator [Blastocatellia bacterium]
MIAHQSYNRSQILNALPDAEYSRLLAKFETVSLDFKQIIYDCGEPVEFIYFPNQCVVSLISVIEGGSKVEVSMVGNEGLVGLAALLGCGIAPNQALTLVAGRATRVEVAAVKEEFNRGGLLHEILLHYMQVMLAQLSQNASCNRVHSIEERLSRWLLMICDRAESLEFSLTHEFISDLLGTRRAGVTVAAGLLQKKDIIRYSRGRVVVVDRRGLEERACKCYKAARQEYDHFAQFLRSGPPL